MINETPLMFEEIQSRMKSIMQEFEKLFNDLNGSQMDIECGTLIETRTDVGYVKYSKSLENYRTLKAYMTLENDTDLFMPKS